MHQDIWDGWTSHAYVEEAWQRCQVQTRYMSVSKTDHAVQFMRNISYHFDLYNFIDWRLHCVAYKLYYMSGLIACIAQIRLITTDVTCSVVCVCVSVCVLVTLSHMYCAKNGCTDRDAVWDTDSCGSMEPCIWLWSRPDEYISSNERWPVGMQE